MEILALVVVGGLFVAYVVWRIRRVRSGLGTFRCSIVNSNVDPETSLTAEGSRGRSGTAHYSSRTLEWWGDLSLGFSPSTQWPRRSIVILEKTPVPRSGQDYVRVRCRVARDRVVELEMTRNAYNGLTSWLEATPTPVDWVI